MFNSGRKVALVDIIRPDSVFQKPVHQIFYNIGAVIDTSQEYCLVA